MYIVHHDPIVDPPPVGPLFVLVHGAWHGSWCWAAVQQELHARGHDSLTVDLPSSHIPAEPTGRLPGLADDVAAVDTAIEKALARVDRPVVLVAHSYGGIPATEIAAAHDQVAQLVYVAAFALAPGEALLDTPRGVTPADEVDVANEQVEAALFNGLDADQRAWAAARLTPQSLRAFFDPQTASLTARRAAGLRTAYVVADRDRILPPEMQRTMAADHDVVAHVDAGHSLWLSAPAQLVDVLLDLVEDRSATTAIPAKAAS